MNRIERACIERGMRMTEQRRVIASVLCRCRGIIRTWRSFTAAPPSSTRGISIATVYRTVKLSRTAEILARHDFRDGRSRYEEAARPVITIT